MTALQANGAVSSWDALNVADAVAAAFARFGVDAVEPLAALLVHPDPDLRLGAVIALGEIASLQPDADVLLSADSHTDSSPLLQLGASGADAVGSASRGSVSVMVPVGGYR